MSYAPMLQKAALLKNSATQRNKSIHSSTLRTLSRLEKSHPETNSSAPGFPIIVHCHLSWDWVWQRPQQFLSRLSKRHKILFIETRPPDSNLVSPLARWETLEAFPNVTVLKLQFPLWQWHDGFFVDQERRRLVQEAIQNPLKGQFDHAVQWFYDPMAVTAFAGHMGEIATVYDCMDELSKFHGAPAELAHRETALLSRADVVFTGGRKLYEAKSRQNNNCHFYGCGVEIEHFGRARQTETVIPSDLSHLPKPVLGYFGVVDERLDYELIAKLADANPRWSVVMIGPVTKVEEHTLPRRRNLHWLGGRDYSQLPAYGKGFDLCLMPFALNAATEFINPTKALEYMAMGREIVSTPVADVVRNFGSVVKVASNSEEFIRACKEALEHPDGSAIDKGLTMAGANSWESIVEKMEKHIDEALARKQPASVRAEQRTANEVGV